MIKFICAIIVLVTSCTAIKEIPIPSDSIAVRYEYRDRLVIDTVFIQDSVTILMKGDTLYNEKLKYVYRYRLVRDTLVLADTVRTTDTKIVEVEKVLSNWQKLKMELGGYAVGVLLVLLLIIFAKVKKMW